MSDRFDGIAVITSDPATTAFLVDNLVCDGFDVVCSASPDGGPATLRRRRPHAAIVSADLIDAAAPHLDGVPILQLGPGNPRARTTGTPVTVVAVPFAYPDLRTALERLVAASA